MNRHGFRTELKEAGWLLRRIAGKLLLGLLPVPVHFALAKYKGRLRPLDKILERKVWNNIQYVYDDTVEAVAMKRIVREYHYYRESTYLWRLLPNLREFKSRTWPVSGITHLHRALNHGKGAILLTAHYGYPHLIPRVLDVYGYKVRQVVAELDRPDKLNTREEWLAATSRVKRYIYEHTKVFSDVLHSEDMVASLDVRPILKALGKNEILLIAGDGLRATEFKVSHLLGKPYPFPVGFVKIGLLTGATVLPAFALPDLAGGTIRIEIHPPLRLDATRSIDENLSEYVRVLNRQLKERPEFWQRWSRENWFEEALSWASDPDKDPFLTRRVVGHGARSSRTPR